MKILINAGHAPGGNPDPGAVGPTGLRESDVTCSVAHMVVSYLRAAGVEAEFIQSDSLEEICETANDGGVDLFPSIHCNSYNETAEGIEAWTSRGWTKSDEFATKLMQQMHSTFPDQIVRGDWSDGDVDKEAGLYVLVNSDCPAALFELPFISNPDQEKWLATIGNQREAAKAFARGVTDFATDTGGEDE